jgi:uncharacterized protein (DUF2252 family)
LTAAERSARGKAARKVLHRRSFQDWAPPSGRPDPIALLEAQAADRVPELLPIRYGRMARTPFAFFRGAAAVMAHDLGSGPDTGLVTQLCGDAHLANFGGFASPERKLVYDINDFDETHPGPFEWDVQRLVASVETAARHRGFSNDVRRDAVARTARAYRLAMASFAGQSNLDIFYSRLDVDEVVRLWEQEASAKSVAAMKERAAKAESKDRLRALAKLTRVVDGEPQILSQPPLLVPTRELFPAQQAELAQIVDAAFEMYRGTLQPAQGNLVGRYRMVDTARKVVGVGSVGARAWVLLLVGRDGDDPLFLQMKQATSSVLEPFTGPSPYADHGRRVVEGQRLMQSAGDVLLGWLHVDNPLGGAQQHYYIRQLWDWKTSADLESIRAQGLGTYAEMCGWVLARAHACTGDPIALAGYLGRSSTFDDALAAFASTYADQNEQDHQALLAAITSGRLASAEG